MKSKALWITVAVIVVLFIAYRAWLANKLKTAIALDNKIKADMLIGKYPPPGTGSVCSADSYICGITAGGTIRCCPITTPGAKVSLKCDEPGFALKVNANGDAKCIRAVDGAEKDPIVVVSKGTGCQLACPEGFHPNAACDVCIGDLIKPSTSLAYNPNINYGSGPRNPANGGI